MLISRTALCSTGECVRVDSGRDRSSMDVERAAGHDVPDVVRSSISAPSSNRPTNYKNSLEESNGAKSQKSDEKLTSTKDEVIAGDGKELNSTDKDVLKTPEDHHHLRLRYCATDEASVVHGSANTSRVVFSFVTARRYDSAVFAVIVFRAGFLCVEALGRIIIRGPYPSSNAIIYMHLQL